MRNTQARNQGLESLNFPTALRVMAEHCQRLLSPHGRSLEEATSFFIEHLERTAKSCSIAELLLLCAKTKKSAGVGKSYLQSFQKNINLFAEYAGAETMVSEITTPQIEEYLSNRPDLGAYTRNSIRRMLETFLSFALANGYCATNAAKAVMKARQIDAPVGILTPRQLSDLLVAAPDEMVPFLAIGAFAGLRTAELRRLDWAQVDLVDGYVEITVKNAKSARRRARLGDGAHHQSNLSTLTEQNKFLL